LGGIAFVPAASSNNRSKMRFASSDAETRGVTLNASRAAIAMIARGASRLSSFSGRKAGLELFEYGRSPSLVRGGEASAIRDHRTRRSVSASLLTARLVAASVAICKDLLNRIREFVGVRVFDAAQFK
jgi:hypothetical protein